MFHFTRVAILLIAPLALVRDFPVAPPPRLVTFPKLPARPNGEQAPAPRAKGEAGTTKTKAELLVGTWTDKKRPPGGETTRYEFRKDGTFSFLVQGPTTERQVNVGRYVVQGDTIRLTLTERIGSGGSKPGKVWENAIDRITENELTWSSRPPEDFERVVLKRIEEK